MALSYGELGDADVWVFDLDNTLYPLKSNLFAQVSGNMTRFIEQHFSLERDAARALQKHYFHQYGTTLRGLMECHDIDPDVFMDFVHDIDISALKKDPQLRVSLESLSARKYIYTNGSQNHARNIVQHLDIAHVFDGIFDIRAGGYVPKPHHHSYDALCAHFAIVPEKAVLVEDMACNLIPAAHMGMTTVWVENDMAWAVPQEDEDYIHHRADDLSCWLRGVTRLMGEA